MPNMNRADAIIQLGRLKQLVAALERQIEKAVAEANAPLPPPNPRLETWDDIRTAMEARRAEIRRLRKRHPELSYREIARRTGVTPQTVINIERRDDKVSGKPAAKPRKAPAGAAAKDG
jgi:hypothetical protein